MSELEDKVLDRPTWTKEHSLIWQNVTEGPMTAELKKADIVFLSEVNLRRLFLGRRGCKTHRTRRLKGLAISWKKSEFTVVKKGYNVFHLSGKAEKWSFPTPARGMLWVVGYWNDDPNERLQFYWLTWFLNSWFPIKPDRDTAKRKSIVLKRSIPVVEQVLEYALAGRVEGVLGGGDTNSIPWNGHIEGVKLIQGLRSLDRIWAKGIKFTRHAQKTPKTGVGNDMRHEGLKVLVRV